MRLLLTLQSQVEGLIYSSKNINNMLVIILATKASIKNGITPQNSNSINPDRILWSNVFLIGKPLNIFRYADVTEVMIHGSLGEYRDILPKCNIINDIINVEYQKFWYNDCCVSSILNITSQEIKIVATSLTYNTSVLANIYISTYNEQRYNMIELQKYKEIKENKEVLDDGFVIINNGDEEHTFKTVWKLACVIITNRWKERNDIIFNRQQVFNEYQICCVKIETTNERKLYEIKNSIEIPFKIYYSTIKLNMDEFNKECKQAQLNYNVKSMITINILTFEIVTIDYMQCIKVNSSSVNHWRRSNVNLIRIILTDSSNNNSDYSNITLLYIVSIIISMINDIVKLKNVQINEYSKIRIDIMNRVEDKVKWVTKGDREAHVFYELQLNNIGIVLPIFMICWLVLVNSK